MSKILDKSTMKNSETIVSGERRLNVVYANSAFETQEFFEIGSRRIRAYKVADENGFKHYATLPVYADGSPTAYDGDSAIIDGKVYDINKSGSKGAYVLCVKDTGNDTIPVKTIKIDDITLPINQYGDVILYNIGVPSPLEIVEEDAVHWMGRQMRLVRLALMGWYPVISE